MSNRITAAKVLLLGISLPKPIKLAFSELLTLPRVMLVLEVETPEGVIKGIGEASIDFPFSSYDAWDVIYALNQLELVGRELNDRLGILSYSWRQRSKDHFYAAQTALNMALDDAYGKHYGVNICQLYGGTPRPGKILETIGLQATVDAFATELTGTLRRGHVPKIKGEAKNLELTLACLKMALEIAPDKSMAMDFNASLDPAQWLAFLESAARLGRFQDHLLFIEQPISETYGLDALRTAHLQARELIGVPVMADESFIDHQAIELVKDGLFLNFKIHKLGGIAIAQAYAAQVVDYSGDLSKCMVGGTFPTAIGRSYDQSAAALFTVEAMPSDGFEPATDWFTGERHLIKEEFPLTSDGLAQPFTGFGLGINPDWEKISRFVIADPRSEYRSIRQTGNGLCLSIKPAGEQKYSDRYQEESGRDILWNL